MSMARLWRDQGKRKEARELLAPVYGWFTEGHETRDLTEARSVAGGVGLTSLRCRGGRERKQCVHVCLFSRFQPH